MSNVAVVIPFYNQYTALRVTLEGIRNLPIDISINCLGMGDVDGSSSLVSEADRADVDRTYFYYKCAAETSIGEAYNQVIADLPEEVQYVLFLRPGIVITDGDLSPLISELEANPKAGTISPLLVDDKGLTRRTGYVIMRAEPVRADVQKPVDMPRVAEHHKFKLMDDHALLVSKKILTEHPFSTKSVDEEGESYRIHAEYIDFDFTLTLFEHGLENLYCPEVKWLSLETPYHHPTRSRDVAAFYLMHGNIQGMNKLNDIKEYYNRPLGNFSVIEGWKDSKYEGNPRPKIYVLLADHGGCGTYRLKNPMRSLVLRGYELLFTSHLEEGYCEWADIIAIQRQVDSKVRAMMNKYRALGKKIIYEIDDFFHSLPVSNPVMPSFRQRPDWLRNMECLIYQSDALIVSTPELAKQYGRFNQNTNIVPNHLDLGAFPIDRIEPNSSSANVRIGWAGSTTHDADMPHMIEAMDMILKEFPQTTMVFMGADYRHLFEDIPLNRMEWIPNTYHHEMPVEEYYENLVDAQLDIGLAPLEDNLFNRCKSDIKIFEYMALGIVPVASDVEPYSNILKQTNAEGTKYGFLAKNTKQWYRRIKTLIEDPGTRYAMGMAGLDKTWTERNLNRMADRYEEIIQKVMDGNGHPKRTEQRMTNGVIETVPKEPMHSLNVPYLGNMTAKQANNNYQHSLAEQKRLAALQTEFVQAQESTG